MKAVIYVRVSSEGQQKDGYSQDAQLKLAHEYAEHNEFKVVRIWKVAESAWKENRTSFNQMIEYVKSHREVKHIIFDIIDRMTRNDSDKVKILTLIKEYDVIVHFSRTNKKLDKNATPDDIFMTDIEVACAKKLSNDISRKSKMGMMEKASQGYYPGVAPLGYLNHQSTIQGRPIKHLILDEQRAPFIQKIFQYYATGDYSLESLTRQMYAEGLRSKKGAKVAKSAIHKILWNTTYYGKFQWGGTPHAGSHPAIISKGLFDAVQEVFKNQNKPKFVKRSFPYIGLMVCGKCGCAVTAEIKKGKYVYYHCTGFKDSCEVEYVREEKISEQFPEIVRKIIIDEDAFEHIKKTLIDGLQPQLEYQRKKIQSLRAEETKLKTCLKQLYVDKANKKISEEEYQTLAEEWREELKQIQEAIMKNGDSGAGYVTRGIHIIELCNQAQQLYLSKAPSERGSFLREILSNCTLTDASLCPTYRKPYDLFAAGLYRLNWGPCLVKTKNL